VHGEPWNVETDESIAAGERIIASEVMTLKVKKERGGV